jgi:uncharacterized protein YndB with AHSA1/START domain
VVPLTAHVFEFTTTASPGDVWRALTDAGQSRYLHGLQLVSDWRPGSIVEARAGNGHSLRGEVLVADAPHRLSFLFEQGESSAVHLTWEIGPPWETGRPRGNGGPPDWVVVRLTVDEVDGDTEGEAQEVWSPVIAALRGALAPAVSEGPPG